MSCDINAYLVSMHFLDISVRAMIPSHLLGCAMSVNIETYPPTSFSLLQDELLFYICTFLDVKDLISFERTCRRTRKVAAHLPGWSAWRHAVVSRMAKGGDDNVFSHMRDLVGHIVDNITDSGLYGRNEIEKRLISLLEPDRVTRLKLHPLAASSYDSPEENLSHVLNPIVRTTKMLSYWSSSGSDDPESIESVSFIVNPPVALITRVSMRPFSAWFQQGRPIYTPHKVRFTIGGIPLYEDINKLVHPELAMDMVSKDFNMDLDDPAFRTSLLTIQTKPVEFGYDVSFSREKNNIDESLCPMGTEGNSGWCRDLMCFITDEYTVEPLDQLQHFDLPYPVPCINGYLKIDLLGKATRQEADMKYYTCLGYVTCEGIGINGFFYSNPNQTFRFEQVPDMSGDDSQSASDSDSELFHTITNGRTNIYSMTAEQQELQSVFQVFIPIAPQLSREDSQ